MPNCQSTAAPHTAGPYMISNGPNPETPFPEPKPIPSRVSFTSASEGSLADQPPNLIAHNALDPSAPQVINDDVVESLLHRMRAGDRHAAAEFVTKYGPRIRRRVRARMNPSMRRIFDSEELLSTMARRLDQFVHEGRMTAENQARLSASGDGSCRRRIVSAAGTIARRRLQPHRPR